MLSTVEWGEYKIGELFLPLKGRKKLTKEDLSPDGDVDVYSSDTTNNGIMGQTELDADYIVDHATPLYLIFGDHTRAMHIATSDFCVMDNVKVLVPKFKKVEALLFICSAWQKAIPQLGYCRHWTKAQNVKFFLPTKNGKIDFAFMERFVAELEAQRVAELEAQRVAELEAYLTATGLKDYELTAEEQKALEDFDKQNVSWKAVTYQSVFDHIKQGRRLRKEDQLPGSIPFVMAGTTNTGVVGYISNPVASFPKNSITIDIFGNSFYRNYAFGAGDDTGVYWNSKKEYTNKQMLFFTSSMEKSIAGKFSYGKKLRSSQSLDIKMYVPVINGNIDLDFMDTLISAIQKLVIKDVVKYSDRKIAATKQVCSAKIEEKVG